ncbi:MAG: amidohydrolase [Chitinophagaceae bacterium]|nr:amidohydrolase [Chitinophagaceae bacterium]
MKVLKSLFYLSILCFCLVSCSSKQQVDTLVFNATIYTVDSSFSSTEAMAIKDGKIVETGTNKDLQEKYQAKENIDAQGKFIYPGFIDAHAHFIGYAEALQRAGLYGTKSWDEILEILKTFSATHQEGWILGRGWDQNNWPIKSFPTNEKLNELFPNRPVMLMRVDGHAAIVNNKALELANIKAGDKMIGGDVVVKNGKLTGLLIDNAVDLVSAKIPETTDEQFAKNLLQAQENCFAVGLTTIDDCGMHYKNVEKIKALQEAQQLKMRFYIMLSDEKDNYDYADKKGIIKTNQLNVRSFKVYGDGALGSRGACLLQDYADQHGHKGFLLSNPEHFDSVAQRLYSKGFQMCTHAIGDSGNRTILDIYAKYLKGKNDLRWRIEHAQVVNENDFKKFAENSIIPSVQPTHATSDMYWAKDRLGEQREKGAYAYKTLLQQNGWLPLGTDFPVEDISTFKTFYAATIRKDAKGWPEKGYQIENALTRKQTLQGMTIWAAKANFEEKEKGSLEKGKLADFIILDKDLMNANENELLQTNVLSTFINGTKVYQKK